MNIIEKQIKKKFGTKGNFCSQMGYKYKNFATRLESLEKTLARVDDFLSPLDLEVKIIEKTSDKIEEPEKENPTEKMYKIFAKLCPVDAYDYNPEKFCNFMQEEGYNMTEAEIKEFIEYNRE